jgi:hypothetical protein
MHLARNKCWGIYFEPLSLLLAGRSSLGTCFEMLLLLEVDMARGERRRIYLQLAVPIATCCTATAAATACWRVAGWVRSSCRSLCWGSCTCHT